MYKKTATTFVVFVLAVCGQLHAFRWGGSHDTDEDEGYECSRIEFVQRVLERLITCEMKVADLEETLNERIDGVETSLQSQIDSLGSQLAGLETSTEAQFTSLSGQLDTANAQIDDILATLDVTVGFNVFEPASTTVAVGSPIMFTSVIDNIGGHYDVSTGRFTAPVDGIYIFSTTLCPPPNQYLRISIRKNEATDLVLAGWIDGQHSCGSASAVASLVAGDQVYVINSYTDDGAVVQNSVRSNTFTGALITPVHPLS